MAAGQFGDGQLNQRRLFRIADDQGYFGHTAEFIGGPLGVAAGGHHQGIRIRASGRAEGLARLGVGGGGDGAGVDDDDVGVVVRVNQAVAGLGEPAGQYGAVGLIELAAVGFNGDGSRHNGLPAEIGDAVAVVGVGGRHGRIAAGDAVGQTLNGFGYVVHGEEKIIDAAAAVPHSLGGVGQSR